MATTDRPTVEPADVASLATAVGDADLAHLVVPADGDCLAAAGLVARACEATAVPYHVSVVRTTAALADRLAGTDSSATPVVLGATAPDAVGIDPPGPVAPLGFETADRLGGTPDPVAALAGVVAAGAVPSRVAPTLLEAAGLERGPGIGIPTTDLVDGLAHTGLAHGPFSGRVEAAREALADVGLVGVPADDLTTTEARRVASLLALAAVGAEGATDRAATAVERALRPYRTAAPFATLAGHADVLAALAERAPGLGVALSTGTNGREAALEAWREHGRAAHDAVRDADTVRYHGVVVARTEGPVMTAARLLRDYRSPEPVVLAVGAGEAAAASVDRAVGGPLGIAADAADGSSLARDTHGHASFDADRTDRFIEAFREAL